MLELQAASGTQASYKVTRISDGAKEDGDQSEESCEEIKGWESLRVLEEVKRDLEELCNAAGDKGFGPKEYIRAGELFFSPKDKQCNGYDSDY